MDIDDRLALSRRRLLARFGAAAAAAFAMPAAARQSLAQPIFTDYPFQLGVASGDPAPDGFVIWTRLAPDPLVQGHGMPAQPVAVGWEVAADPAFRTIVRSGEAIARPELGHAVHVEVAGLESARDYHYRFRAGRERSLTGRARTTPAAGAPVDRVRFAVAGCQHYETGLYTAHRHMAGEELDFVYCYGDYIYEGRGAAARNTSEGPVPTVRRHIGDEIYSLDDYRRRYAQYKLDTDLQAAHAAAPWFAVWDDHETDNNWAAAIDQDDTPAEYFALRRQIANQAYYENMPLRRTAFPMGTAIQLYRRAAYGRLLDLNLLDTRQFRSDQPCGGVRGRCDELERPATMLGDRQEAWLLAGLSASEARWKVIAQQVMVMDLDRDPGPDYVANTDSWGGYRTPRGRLLRHIRDRRIADAVVLTGDEHQNFAGELHLDGRDPRGAAVGVEFVATSISSGGDGVDLPDAMARVQAVNPQLRFVNSQRGYVVCEATDSAWRTDFKVVDRVTAPGGALSTRKSFVVEPGRPGLQDA